MTSIETSAGLVAKKNGHHTGRSAYRSTNGDSPDVLVVGTVRAPVGVVWELFRPFGAEMMRWWPIYEWVELEPPGLDQVGARRHFKANGRVYTEELVQRDDKSYTERYKLVDSEVAIPMRSVMTTVQMESLGNFETMVRWSSKTDANPLFLPLIKLTQRTAYQGAIDALARYFNPATEVLEVRVVEAELPRAWGIVPPSSYVTVQLGGGESQRTSLRAFSAHPQWSSSLQFNRGARDRALAIAVWDSRLGPDELVGTASIELPELTTSWTEQSVALEGAEGSVTLALRTRPEFQVLRDSMSLAKNLGSTLGGVLPPLKQLGFEIGLVDTAIANAEITVRSYLTKTLGMTLPSSDDHGGATLPGLFLLDVGRAALGMQRAVASLTKQFLALSQEVVESIRRGKQAEYGYARYTRSPEIPDVPLENLPRMVKGLPLQELLPPSKIGAMVQRGLEFAFSEFDLVERYRTALLRREDPFEAFMYDWVERPNPVVDHWKDDAEFCRQLIQGVNPLTIRMVRSLAEVPRDMKALSAQGKSLEALVEEQRLFILDYVGLDGLKPHRNMVFYAPIVLVYREILEDDKGSRLNLLGIQLTRNEGYNRVYTRITSPPNRYLYAKIQVACADNQYHQFINHLGYAHLGTEPMVIAHHNAFHAHGEHPIGRLLAPHFKETIGINYLARQTLVASQHAFTDKTFAPGTAQALQLFLWAWERYDFFANSFPEELRARGFDEEGTDGVENYYYRDDGFKIWRAFESYAKDVVYAVYRDDQALANDAVVQGWAWESCAPDRAAIPGFPNAIVTRAALVRVLTTILFQTSAFHSAVNFPQAQYLVYVPNRPDATLAKMPEGDADITLEFIYLNAMPSFGASSFQISFAILLTVPPDATIARDTALAKEFPEIYEKHQKRLAQIVAELRARNDALVAASQQPYPYLSPERIATSVAI